MRIRWLLLCLLGSLLIGCARKAPPAVPKAAKSHVAQSATVKEDVPETPDAPLTPAQLAQKLQDADASVAADAARMLGELGEPGFPHLFKGLQHSTAEVRAASIEGFTPELVRQHQRELVPLFLTLLEEKAAPVRKRSCVALTWADQMLLDNEIQAGALVKERFAALKKVAIHDKDAEVRSAAIAGMQSVQQAIAGKIDRTALKTPVLDPKDKSDGPGARSGDRSMPKRELPR